MENLDCVGSDACKSAGTVTTPPKGEQAPQTLGYYKDMMAKDAVEMQSLAGSLKNEKMTSSQLREKLMKCRIRVGELSRELAEAKQIISELKNGR